eukprot:403362227
MEFGQWQSMRIIQTIANSRIDIMVVFVFIDILDIPGGLLSSAKLLNHPHPKQLCMETLVDQRHRLIQNFQQKCILKDKSNIDSLAYRIAAKSKLGPWVEGKIIQKLQEEIEMQMASYIEYTQQQSQLPQKERPTLQVMVKAISLQKSRVLSKYHFKINWKLTTQLLWQISKSFM